MNSSKRIFLWMIACCFVYFISLLLTRRYWLFTLGGKRRRGLGPLSNDFKFSSYRVPPVVEDYRNSRLFRTLRENIPWKKRKILSNINGLIDSNHSTNVIFVPRYEQLRVAWFSMPDEWREHVYPRSFTCSTGTVVVNNPDLNPDKLASADVVVFSSVIENRSLWERLQATRHPLHVWLFNSGESPLSTRTFIPPRDLRNITFNMTYTYRSDADISVACGEYLKFQRRHAVNVVTTDYHGASPKFAAWVVPNPCDSSSASWDRTAFIRDLSRYLPIDKYGACDGALDCGDTEESCKELLRQYKFHFALENSCCTEYISTSFWNVSCHYDAIPIVVGAKREDYIRVAPPNSFIYAADFTSMEKLAEYVKGVAGDPELFNSFFAWKAEGDVRIRSENQRRVGMHGANCRILKYLQDPRLTLPQHDLHGPEWMGGCVECADSRLLGDYRTSD